MLTIFGLPTVFMVNLVHHMQSTVISSGVEWHLADNISYPQITVCYPKFFTKRAMAGRRKAFR